MGDVCWCPYCDKANFIDCEDLDETEEHDYNCQRCKKKFNFRFLWKADINTTQIVQEASP